MSRHFVAALIAGVATFTGVLVALRHGTAVSPDGWAYWSSSVSLLEGKGYIDAHGLPIESWPPLYPLWLAVVQGFVGVTIWGTQVADALVMGVAAGAFSMWALRRMEPRETWGQWSVVGFVVAASVAQTRGLGAHYLGWAFVGLLLLGLDGLPRARSGAGFWVRVAWVVVVGAGLCLTRNASVAMIAAVPLWLWRQPTLSRRQKTVVGGLVLMGALGVWYAVRIALGQGGSHDLEGTDRGLVELVVHASKHVGRGLGPFPLGIVWFAGLCVWLSRSTFGAEGGIASTSQGDVVGWVVGSLACTIGLMAVVEVTDPPGERFVGFASTTIGALGVAALGGQKGSTRGRTLRLRWRIVAVVVLLAPGAARAGKHIALGRRGDTTVTDVGGQVFLPPEATLHSHYGGGGRPVYSAPLFKWLRERLESGEGR